MNKIQEKEDIKNPHIKVIKTIHGTLIKEGGIVKGVTYQIFEADPRRRAVEGQTHTLVIMTPARHFKISLDHLPEKAERLDWYKKVLPPVLNKKKK